MTDNKEDSWTHLQPEQQKFLPFLISLPTVREASKAGGVSESTAYRWLREAAFKEVYRIARREALEVTIASLQAASGKAVETLLEVAQDREVPATARVSASKTILEYAIKATETEELIARIEKLENVMTEVREDAIQ